MVNYKDGKIYKIVNDVNDEVYVGSTCLKLCQRMTQHRGDRIKENRKNLGLYKLMNDLGVERFRIELLEDYPCERREQLVAREGYYIKQIGTGLNRNVAGRTKKEYRLDNQEKCKERESKYQEKNKDKIKERKAKYREKNKEKIKEHQAKYYQDNKDKFREYRAKYYQEHKIK